MEIIGYVPKFELMEGIGLKTQHHGVAHDQFIKDYHNEGIKFTNTKDVVNIYLGHDPHLIASSENGVGLNDLSVCDFFVTGHLHNGYKTVLDPISKVKKIITGKGLKSIELDKGLTDQILGLVNRHGEHISWSRRPWLGMINLCRGIVYIDDNSQQKYLQLPDGKFYKNKSDEDNVQIWNPVMEEIARMEILKNNLHFMLISEGISPYFFPLENVATVNVVDIVGKDVKVKKKVDRKKAS